jgi:hypothetical protein
MRLVQRKNKWVVYDDHNRVVIISHHKKVCLLYMKGLGHES